MLTQVSNINKLLLKRLVVLWFVASVIVGGIVFYIETEAVDNAVVELGLKEAYSINQSLIKRLPENDSADNAALQKIVDEMTRRQFVIAEIYNKDEIIRAKSIRIDSKKVETVVDEKHHSFPLGEERHHKKFYIDNVLYIQHLVPLKYQDHIQGYFEGIYRVSDSELNEIMSRLYHTLLIVLTIILATFVMMYPVILYLNRQLIAFSKNLLKANVELLEVMGSAVAKRDSTTDNHNYRVTLYAVRFGEALKLDSTQMCNLIAGSFLHDVGKIGIEDSILRKPGGLDDKEFTRMKEHVEMGVEIVAKADWLKGAGDVIKFHHEKYDGSGYMTGLKGENIPLIARMFAIVDVFDALCSERPYKKAFSIDDSLQIMSKQSGRHFDPKLLDTFFKLSPKLHTQIGKASYSNLTQMLSVAVHKHFFKDSFQ